LWFKIFHFTYKSSQGKNNVPPIHEHTTTLSSGTIFSLQSGPVSGQAILLLHGMKFSAKTWKDLGTIDKLAEAGFRTIALDMPGFGKSPESVLSANAVLTEFMEEEDIKQPILIGPSMGGKICLEFCIAHAESVKALVLIGSVGVQENATKLKEIEVPALIVWGSEDRISPNR